MSTELKPVAGFKHKELQVTRFFNGQSRSLQLTQGIGTALGNGEPGFVQVDKQQALELIKTLADFVAGE